jgi:hypothetical protein
LFCIISSATEESIWLKDRDVPYHGARRFKVIRTHRARSFCTETSSPKSQERRPSFLANPPSPGPPLLPSFRQLGNPQPFPGPPQIRTSPKAKMKRPVRFPQGRRHRSVYSLRHENHHHSCINRMASHHHLMYYTPLPHVPNIDEELPQILPSMACLSLSPYMCCPAHLLQIPAGMHTSDVLPFPVTQISTVPVLPSLLFPQTPSLLILSDSWMQRLATEPLR